MSSAGRIAFDAVVVGGGIAGLSAAAALSPHMRVCLIERERLCASQASGRNAAIFRPLEADDHSAALARRSLQLLAPRVERPVLSAVGLVLASGSTAEVRAEAERARRQAVPYQLLVGADLWRALPPLLSGEAAAGLLLPEGGVLDIHEITSTLERVALHQGAALQTSVAVEAIEASGGRVQAVRLANGRRLPCLHVVIAAGAWAGALGRSAGAPLPLTPMRRHLVHLRCPAGGPAGRWPVLWRIDRQVYFRREGSGLLASPCDETPVPEPAGPPVADRDVLPALAEEMLRLAPGWSSLAVQQVWACFRTFAADRELVIGPDPRLAGLHWLSGLGGRGMGVGPAAGELVARAVLGSGPPVPAPFRVQRLLAD